MELTQSPIGVTAIRGMAASGLATTRALLLKTNTGKMLLSPDAATRDAPPLSPYVRIAILLAVVIGGLVLSVSFIVFCSHFLKKVKQLKRRVGKATERTEDPERGQYRSLLKRPELGRDEPSTFVHPAQINPVTIHRPDEIVAQTILNESREIEVVEHPTTSGLDNDIDYAFAVYKGEITASEPDDEASTGSHLQPPKSSPTSSDIELELNDVTKRDVEEEVEEVERGSRFQPIDRFIHHRRHVSFELKNANSASVDCQPQTHEDNRLDDRLTLQPKGLSGLKQVSFDAGRYSQTPAPALVGPTASQRTDDRPTGCSLSPTPLKPRMRQRCMTMDPKLQVQDKSFEVRADVHRNQAPTGAYASGATGGIGKTRGVSRNLWLSVALENRRLVEEQRPYWNSLELGHDRKMEGNLTRLVNSYDEQIIVPSRITYDPLRITEFLNGPNGDDEFGHRPELRSDPYPPKKVKVFTADASFDATDVEERKTSRTDDGDMELQGTSVARKDSVVSRRDSMSAFRRDSLSTESASSSFVRQQTWGSRTFRGIAMSRTIDVPDRMLTRKDAPVYHHPQQKQGPPDGNEPTDVASTTVNGNTKDPHPTSVRRQMYGSAFSNRSRRSTEGAAGENSFDSVATDVDASESSHCEVTTTSIESSTTTASTDSTGDARSSHKLHQMRDDSGYKSLETQQSLGRTGTQSLDVQVMPCRRIAGQSLDSQIYMPRVVVGVGGRSPERVKSSLRGVAESSKEQRRVAEGRSKGRPPLSLAEEKATPKVRMRKAESEALSLENEARALSLESSPRESSSSLQSKNFLEVPSAERDFRLPLTKARSQDCVGSRQDETDSASSNVPSSASSIFPVSLERLWHRAEHYLSSAVIQAESLLGVGSRDNEPSVSPAPDDVPVIQNTVEVAAENISDVGKPNLDDDFSFPPGRQSLELEHGKSSERAQDLETVTSTLLAAPPQTYRVSDTVIRPVWSQLIAEKEALALEEKKARESGVCGGGGSVLHTKVDAIRRGDLKTASKKRREYRSRKQLTEVSDSSLEPLSFDRLLGGHRDGEPSNTPDLKRSLTARDYTVDEKTYAIFNEFLQYDPKFDKCSGAPSHATAPSASATVEFSFETGSHQHPTTMRLGRKQTDSVPESKRSFQGPYPTTRSGSLDVEKTGPARSPKYDYDSIAEETLPLEVDS